MKIHFIIFFVFAFSVHVQAQYLSDAFEDGRREIYFSFSKTEVANLQDVADLIYIDRIKGDSVFAYANFQQFSAFMKKDMKYKVETPPSMKYANPVMQGKIDVKSIQDWDFYPTYDAYLDMMQQFEEDYPELCQLVEIGSLSSGRKILALRISDNIDIREEEPEFLYTSSIHGDETTGYVMLLRLADYLLSHYGNDALVTKIVQSTDIYLNPLANPDGTFAGGNNTVFGATRTNSNGIDINRNFPDPEDGNHPDGNAWQEETILFMNFAESHNFTMSANLHGGAEVCNYPWDTWSKRHADEVWWQMVCREYADTAQAYSPPGYMDSYNNGITNGYDWYSINGGRQDYMNYFQQCREFTLEISTIKTLPAYLLPDYWDYNYRSLLNYMNQVNYGLLGVVTDGQSGAPVKAEVRFIQHDTDSSIVFSDSSNGRYQRPAAAGVYNVKFSAPGYIPEFINGVVLQERDSLIHDISLNPAAFYADFYVEESIQQTGYYVSFTNLSYGEPEAYQWYFEGGLPPQSSAQDPPDIRYDNPGDYDVSLTVYKDGDSSTLYFEDYIKIDEFYLMQSEVVESCSGYFFDSGGRGFNYSNNEAVVMHFKPDDPAKRLVFCFEYFSVEFDGNCDYDWLKIYNGESVNSELIGTYCGAEIPDTIIAENPAGALTFKFQSDYSENREGWMARFYCDSNVSIIEDISKPKMLFFPNPVSDDVIYLESDSEYMEIQIYDMAGFMVLNAAVNNDILDISSLKQGVYIIKFISGEGIYSSKLLRY